MKIILDTNFLIYSVAFKIDFLEELRRICDFSYEVYILDKTMDELQSIKSRYAALAVDILKNRHIAIVKTKKDKNVDNLVLDMVGNNKNYMVATQDREFKEKLNKKGIKVIYIRQKSYFKID